MLPRLILLSALLASTGCVAPVDVGGADVAADAGPGEVAFEMAEPADTAILVPVMIGDRGPYDFVLDTGATITCVGDSIANELNLPEKKGVIGRGATLSESGRMRLVEIDSIRIGDTEVSDVTACTIDLSQIRGLGLEVDGLLGLNVLKNFRVTLDFERKVMRLEPVT